MLSGLLANLDLKDINTDLFIFLCVLVLYTLAFDVLESTLLVTRSLMIQRFFIK